MIQSFGEKEEGQDYTARYGAYIVISRQDRQEIILVQAPNGAFFLPGGEIEAGEDKLAAIHREIMEELGFTCDIGEYLGEADEYFYSRHRNTYYYNPGYFFSAKSWEQVSEPLEKTNQLYWFPVLEAIQQLKRGSHKWAVKKWLEKETSADTRQK